ncbi:MAG TPA: ComEC family competence protein [Candidatus Odoribacter faecigallinarum]|uniref:ComEC family competence protein n=1 Tax=Candidatus Odoribacter faecigallinarum TaxID=2838706 RepID=A0A9D1UYA9_9BACT|nr:ComEC family competence protein [Candidatus Odoribacter faecigallinarum]
MKFNRKYPFLYLLIALMGGILCNTYFTLPAWCMAGAWVAALSLFRFSRAGTDLCLLAAFFCIGNASPHPTPREYNPESVYLLQARCEEELAGNNYILTANGDRFYLSRFSIDTTYHTGDSLRFYTRILPFRYNGNPYEFSYAHYMKQQGVFYQLRPVTPPRRTGQSHTLLSYFNEQRAKLLRKTEQLTQDSTCVRLINALCLGYRNDMQKDLNELFIKTGTVHLLSVSGLHVGAIYWLLMLFFRRLHLSRWTTLLLVLPLLWGYACLTGMEPAVARAATILSFFAISQTLSRHYNPVNILAASALLTLLFQPSALYSVSFLMSYSAYAGIMLLYPYLFRLPGKLPKLPSKVYSCCCITLAAQIPTIPICAYYFHTLNANGIIANLVAVPLSTLLLYGATICLILPLAISQYLMPACEMLCKALLSCLQWLSPYMLNLQNLYPTPLTILLLYIILFVFGYYLLNRKTAYLYATVGGMLALLLTSIATNFYISSRKEIVVFHHYRQSSVILNYNGFYLPLKHSCKEEPDSIPYLLRNKLKALPPTAGVLGTSLYWYPPICYLPNDTLFIADKNTLTPYRKATILIVTNNLYPQHLFGSDTPLPYPRKIILDGSNHSYCAQAWEQFCKEHHIDFLNSAEQGAIYLPIK